MLTLVELLRQLEGSEKQFLSDGAGKLLAYIIRYITNQQTYQPAYSLGQEFDGDAQREIDKLMRYAEFLETIPELKTWNRLSKNGDAVAEIVDYLDLFNVGHM